MRAAWAAKAKADALAALLKAVMNESPLQDKGSSVQCNMKTNFSDGWLKTTSRQGKVHAKYKLMSKGC